MTSLVKLKPGEIGRVVKLDDSCQGYERYRLLDLGVVPGTKIRYALNNPLKEPVAYTIRGAVIALRNDQAKKILIEIEG